MKKIKEYKGIIIIVLVLILGVFYWYSYRPEQIRIECSKGFNLYYSKCLQQHGLNK